MKKNLVFLSLLVLIFVAFSCNKKELFEQPTVEVTGYTLTELPGDSAHIEVNMTLVNNDKRDALVKDAQYIVDIEGFISGTENVTIDKQIFPDTIYEFTLPLTLATEDAIQLLVKMDKGEELSYIATGTFHVEDPYLKGFDWPIDVSGKALVITGFEDYFEQPDVVVDSVEVVYTINGTLPFATSYDFDKEVYCSVTNNDNRKVE
ncbi:MAG: hypothetical protein U9Q83_05650, partial [Bacteroidota bacterium]|nr:hypothetical protein [Bacteroidota bacterium]